MLGKIESRRTREQQRMRWFEGINDSGKQLQKIVKDREVWHAVVQEVVKSWI